MREWNADRGLAVHDPNVNSVLALLWLLPRREEGLLAMAPELALLTKGQCFT
jgi:hypothetical protein